MSSGPAWAENVPKDKQTNRMRGGYCLTLSAWVPVLVSRLAAVLWPAIDRGGHHVCPPLHPDTASPNLRAQGWWWTQERGHTEP